MDGSAFRGLEVFFKLVVVVGILVLCGAIATSYYLGRRSMSKYQAAWAANSKNEAFWNEVLVGRKIVSITWDDKGVSGFKLDSGEWVGVKKNEHDDAVIFIED